MTRCTRCRRRSTTLGPRCPWCGHRRHAQAATCPPAPWWEPNPAENLGAALVAFYGPDAVPAAPHPTPAPELPGQLTLLPPVEQLALPVDRPPAHLAAAGPLRRRRPPRWALVIALALILGGCTPAVVALDLAALPIGAVVLVLARRAARARSDRRFMAQLGRWEREQR